MQLRRKPLTASEFLAPLSKMDPIYAEIEDGFKVKWHNVRKRGRDPGSYVRGRRRKGWEQEIWHWEINAVVLLVLQNWFGKTPLGKKRSKAVQGGDADAGAKKAKKGKKGKK